MALFIDSLRKETAELHQHGIQLRFTGDRSRLSSLLQEQMHEAELLTQANQQLILNVVINYGGKWDITNAAKKIAQAVVNKEIKVADIDEALFAQHLDTCSLPDPDLLIRTSGELRISNFFLWQLAYTEFYFTDVHWPDFNATHLELALDSFCTRKRRFGMVNPQVCEVP